MLASMNVDGVLIATTSETIGRELRLYEAPVVVLDALLDVPDVTGYVYL